MPTAQVLSVTPKVKDTLLVKVPVVRNSFIDQYVIAAELCSRTSPYCILIGYSSGSSATILRTRPRRRISHSRREHVDIAAYAIIEPFVLIPPQEVVRYRLSSRKFRSGISARSFFRELYRSNIGRTMQEINTGEEGTRAVSKLALASRACQVYCKHLFQLLYCRETTADRYICTTWLRTTIAQGEKAT